MIKNIDAALLYQMTEQNDFLCGLSFFNSHLTANVKNIKQKLFCQLFKKMTNTDKPREFKIQLKCLKCITKIVTEHFRLDCDIQFNWPDCDSQHK
jgi:hypothetical protein